MSGGNRHDVSELIFLGGKRRMQSREPEVGSPRLRVGGEFERERRGFLVGGTAVDETHHKVGQFVAIHFPASAVLRSMQSTKACRVRCKSL